METDTRLLATRLAGLLAREHAALAEFLVALADFDRERRWVELGYTSLFWFLHRSLGLSKGAASCRKVAAKLIQRFPEVIAPLRSGKLCLSSVAELAGVLTPENQAEVLPRFFHASKQEAKAIAAELCPNEAPPRRDVVTALHPALRSEAARAAPAPAAPLLAERPAPPAPAEQVHPADPSLEAGPRSPPVPFAPAAPAAKRDATEPLTVDLSRLHVTVSRRFLAKLAAARDALSHRHPGASAEAVLEAGLDLLLAERDRKRGLVEKPRKAPAAPSARPRHVPASLRRAVFTRDEGKCQWPMDGGGVCGSTTRLELDHVVPLARGGTTTLSNLRIACAFHNQLAARQLLGAHLMDRYTGRGRGANAARVSGGAAPEREQRSEPDGDSEAPSLPFG
ncbi:MAG: HNH endonuclease [Anaeromyxobacteraceae bacterium]